MNARALLVASVGWMVCVLAGGCARQAAPPSGPHPPLSASQVKIYEDPPLRYERLGTLTAPQGPAYAWKNGDADAAVDALKAQAAQMGANGIMMKPEGLSVPPQGANLRVLIGYHGKYYTGYAKDKPEAFMVEAIYVIKE